MKFPKPYADKAQRFRVPGGFLMLGSFVVLSDPTWESFWVGLAVSTIGIAIRCWAAGHLSKNESLAQSGPYAWVRNPLYLGSLFLAGGVVAASRSWWLMGVFLGTFLLIYLPVIQLEEEHLRNIFLRYAAYAERVPSLLPWRGPIPSTQPFRWEIFRGNKEWRAIAGYGFALAVLVGKILW